ncbi:MAG: T9SS type A sorting domain-containing protein [Saprospiraceae bacterium]|nr:T9SS type A sorting domain-containing protein [Saprospiraceae bacterium]
MNNYKFSQNNLTCSIFNLQGNEIMRKKITESDLRVDISHLSNSIYYYIIREESKEISSGKINKI